MSDITSQPKDIMGWTWQKAFYIQTKAFLEKNSEHIKEIERLKSEIKRLTEDNHQLQARCNFLEDKPYYE